MKLQDVIDLINSTYDNRIQSGDGPTTACEDAIRAAVEVYDVKIPPRISDGPTSHEMGREDILRLVQGEYGYWKGHDRDDAVGLMAMGAMGALSNVIAAIAMNRWGVTQNEGNSYGMARATPKE